MGLAHAAEALVGKAIGQQRRDILEESVKLCLKWSLIFAVGFSVFYFVAGPLLINIVTDLPDLRETTMRYLPWMIVSPLVSVWSFLYDGVYVGADACARDAKYHGGLGIRRISAGLVPAAATWQ